MADTSSSIAYCGPGAAPGELMARWNLDPWVIGGLLLAALIYAAHRRRGGAGDDVGFTAALIVLALIFVSPLCALSASLFSARVAHHALLVALAAPLLAYGLPRAAETPSLALLTAVQAAVFWAWHAPPAYDWALSSDAAYWMMQATLLGSAIAFWAAIRRAPALAAAGGLFATMVQMGLLGALIVFAGRPLYAPHLTTTWPWGLSPLEDQQLAGLIMWAPMAGVYLLAALWLVGRLLGRDPTVRPAT